MAKRNYEQIALCVLTSPNLKAAAEKAGVSYNTLIQCGSNQFIHSGKHFHYVFRVSFL